MAIRNSLPRICIAMGFSDVDKLLQHARREFEEGERFFEFRLDYLPEPERGVQLIRSFLDEHPDAAVDAGARAVDLEVESAEGVGVKLDALRGRTCFILSYHNFETTPAMES